MAGGFFKRLALFFPGLQSKLISADIYDAPEDFVRKTLLTALYLSGGMSLAFAVIINEFGGGSRVLLSIPPVLFLLLFFYFMKVPDVKMKKKEREINREIVFAVRFLIIELQSGVSLYNAMKGIEKNYEVIGKYFKEIVDRIDLGTPLEVSINESIEMTPSNNFRRVLWQVINSLNTGSDVAASLNSTVDQIANEQLIEVKEYGRKLNPLAMFYMMVAVIIPSIGMVMLVMMSSFLGIKMDISLLLTVVGMLGFMQFMFFSVIKTSRPPIDL